MGSRVPPFYPKVLWCSRRCCGCPAHASAPFTSTSRRTWCCAMLSHVRLFVTLWTVAHQAPMPMEFSRQEYWSGLLFPPPRNLPETRIEPGSPALQANSLQSNPDLSQATVFHRTLHKFPLPVPTWGQDICGFLNWLIVNSRSELPTSLLNSSLPQISHNSK